MSKPLFYEKTAEFAVPEGHAGGLTAVAFSSSGQFLATAGLDCKVCIWRVSDRRLLHTLSGRSLTLCISWLPSSDDSLLCGMRDGCVTAMTFREVCSAPYYLVQLIAHNIYD